MTTAKKFSRYSKAEDDVIREYCGRKTAEEIGLIMGTGRKPCSIMYRATRIGVPLRLSGENHKDSKLSETNAMMIKALFDSGFEQCEILYLLHNHIDISKSAVQKIGSGKTWRG